MEHGCITAGFLWRPKGSAVLDSGQYCHSVVSSELNSKNYAYQQDSNNYILTLIILITSFGTRRREYAICLERISMINIIINTRPKMRSLEYDK